MRKWITGHGIGQGLVEYALVLVLLALAVILVVTVTGIDLQITFCQAVNALSSTNDCGHYFTDDFANLNAWKIVSGTWKTVNGVLTGGPNEGRIFHDMSQSDYTINLKNVTLNQGNGYGVFFRSSNTSQVNGYSFQFDPGYNGFVMRKWVNGNELAPFAVASAPGYNWNAPNRQVQVVVKGNTFTAFVDGKKVLQGSDNTYSSGGVGLRTWDGTNASFDGITVDSAK